MLIYHFGSREGLLTEVVRLVETQQRDALAQLSSLRDTSPREVSVRFWSRVVEPVRGRVADESRGDLARPAQRAPETLRPHPADARIQARLSLAVARRLLHDLLLTGDRAEVDDAMEVFIALLESGATATHSGETP